MVAVQFGTTGDAEPGRGHERQLPIEALRLDMSARFDQEDHGYRQFPAPSDGGTTCYHQTIKQDPFILYLGKWTACYAGPPRPGPAILALHGEVQGLRDARTAHVEADLAITVGDIRHHDIELKQPDDSRR